MFTGIVQAMGTINGLDKDGDWRVLIACPDEWGVLSLGSSVACDGVCLTVIEAGDGFFLVQVSGETVSKTTLEAWAVGRAINLERALRLGDELGGHIVTGHVDAVASIVSVTPEQESLRFVFQIPESFAKFIAPKGSVALDGISLTVNEVQGTQFGVNIIPHTQFQTTLGARQAGDQVNFEVDTIARYVARMMAVA